MPDYWVRNKKGQVAAEVSDVGLSVHDQGLSWQLHKLKTEGAAPFDSAAGAGGRSWNLESMLQFLEQKRLHPRTQGQVAQGL